MLTCLLPGSAHGKTFKKSILYLNSYHHGYQWSDSIFEGIRSRLKESPYTIDLQVEYLDAKKYNSTPVIEGLLEVFRRKFTNEHYDAVIVSDDDAFNFALRFRSDLFPGVPIVFSGVNDLEPHEISIGNLTGVVESFDLAGTIDAVLMLHPDKKRMVVIGDESTAGRAIKKQIEALVPRYKDKLQVEYWIQVDLADAQRRVKTLSNDSFLFFIPYYQIIGNRTYTAEEVMKALSLHARVPIYTSWAFLLGHGAVGGSMLSGQKHGRTAAGMALQILEGADPAVIPIASAPTGDYMFDYQVMQQLGIDEDSLPDGSTIINSPKAFYELSKELFWTIIVSFLLLLVTLVFLVLTMMGRRRVERKIKDQLTFQETLMDTNPQLVSWKDLNLRYLGANRTFAEVFGLDDPSEVIGKTIDEVVNDLDYAAWSQSADVAVINNRESFRKVRHRLTDHQGNTAWIEVNKVPLRDQSGKVVGILSTAENITRELDLEKQLLQSQKMEAIGTLASGIAHDFNNILTSIINSTELAIGDVPADSQTASDLERVLKAARRGSRVVKQILAFSKPSQEGFQTTDLTAVMTEVIGLMEVSLPGNIELRSHISPAAGMVLADPTQLYQATMNLCTNSFQALRDQGGTMQIRLDQTVLDPEEAQALNLGDGNYVRVTVADDGPGIPADIIDKIFDPFFSTKDKTEGTGLGLAVVHGIVKAHKGGLRVDSNPGQGTTFQLFFPVIEAVGEKYEERHQMAGTRHCRILFVEDDEDQLHTAPRILTEAGFSVIAAGTPRQAIEHVAAAPDAFDLVITDYDMPGMNGLELLERIHLLNPSVPFLLVSGREDAIPAALSYPSIRRVFIKPYDRFELISTINTILEEA
jgi:PAS domain S-box-containing protein